MPKEMTTTELIELLAQVEYGASGRSREISIDFNGTFYPCPQISISSTGDGCAGAELCLKVTAKPFYNKKEMTARELIDEAVICLKAGLLFYGTINKRVREAIDLLNQAKEKL